MLLSARMASIVAYTEIQDAAITAASRFALAEARRVADDARGDGVCASGTWAYQPRRTRRFGWRSGNRGRGSHPVLFR